MRRLTLTAVLGGTAVMALLGAAAAQAGGGGHGGCIDRPMADSKGLEVAMESACFTPTVLRVEPGDTVTWTNVSPPPHTVTGANASWGDFTQFMHGEDVSHTFAETGVYPYYCALHPGMIGAVVVGDGSPSGPSAARDRAPDQESKGTGVVSTALIAGLGVALAASGAGGGFLVARRFRR